MMVIKMLVSNINNNTSGFDFQQIHKRAHIHTPTFLSPKSFPATSANPSNDAWNTLLVVIIYAF